MGFVLGAALILVLHFTNVLSGPGRRQVEPFSEVPPTMAASLAARFRPWLLFDTHEHWQPLNVDSLLDEGTHKFCRGAGNTDCTLIANHGEFEQLVRQTPELGAHLNLDGSSVGQYRGSASCTPSSLFDCGTGPGSAIYYHVTDSNDRFYIDYWWFLRFNHFAITKSLCLSQDLQKASVCDEHEGDWEGVTVVTPPNDPSRAAYVVYAAHKGSFRYSTTSLQMKGADNTRPVVYLASGSHAAYPIPCTGDLCFQPVGLAAGGLIDIPDGRYNGAVSWARNPDAQCDLGGAGSCLIPLSDQPWTNWPGQWGDGCESACGGAGDVNSPQSPGLQARYQTPWCSTETVGITCDGRVGHLQRLARPTGGGGDLRSDPAVQGAALEQCPRAGGSRPDHRRTADHAGRDTGGGASARQSVQTGRPFHRGGGWLRQRDPRPSPGQGGHSRGSIRKPRPDRRPEDRGHDLAGPERPDRARRATPAGRGDKPRVCASVRLGAQRSESGCHLRTT